ncbi:MAG: ABC transporter permease [Lachnospiraceae bacterium]|nr:ABC transporter permease [Lachnospiraceae bacterium]
MAGKVKTAKKRKKFTLINLLQWLTLAALLIFMQVEVKSGRISKVFLAAPTDIIEKGYKMTVDGTLLPHLWATVKEVLAGFGLSAAVGIGLGFIWVLFPKLEEYMNVFCSAIMAVPKTAILPLLILWFGIGFKSKIVLIFLFGVFTILYNTLTGAKQTRIEYLKVARVFEANRFQTVFKVMVPAALPSIFNGLKLSAATALTGVIFAEMQSAREGLGYLLTEAQNNLNTPRVFFVIILVTVISVLFVKLISTLEYSVCHKWTRV